MQLFNLTNSGQTKSIYHIQFKKKTIHQVQFLKETHETKIHQTPFLKQTQETNQFLKQNHETQFKKPNLKSLVQGSVHFKNFRLKKTIQKFAISCIKVSLAKVLNEVSPIVS